MMIGNALALLIALVFAPLSNLIVALNAIHGGSTVAILVCFWKLIIATIRGKPPFDRPRIFALGVLALWVAYDLGIVISIYSRAVGDNPTPYMFVVASRWFAIVAAWWQVTSLNWDSGFFENRNRKVLWTAVAISVVVSIVLIIAQSRTILSD